MENNTPKLPFLPSQLIAVAMADFRAIRKNKAYTIEMGNWHHPALDEGKCAVCLAGSVIAETLKGDSEENLEPLDFDDVTADRLRALDNFREGQIEDALELLGIMYNSLPADLRNELVDAGNDWVGYEDNARKFMRCMDNLGDLFEEYGY